MHDMPKAQNLETNIYLYGKQTHRETAADNKYTETAKPVKQIGTYMNSVTV